MLSQKTFLNKNTRMSLQSQTKMKGKTSRKKMSRMKLKMRLKTTRNSLKRMMRQTNKMTQVKVNKLRTNHLKRWHQMVKPMRV